MKANAVIEVPVTQKFKSISNLCTYKFRNLNMQKWLLFKDWICDLWLCAYKIAGLI